MLLSIWQQTTILVNCKPGTSQLQEPSSLQITTKWLVIHKLQGGCPWIRLVKVHLASRRLTYGQTLGLFEVLEVPLLHARLRVSSRNACESLARWRGATGSWGPNLALSLQHQAAISLESASRGLFPRGGPSLISSKSSWPAFQAFQSGVLQIISSGRCLSWAQK